MSITRSDDPGIASEARPTVDPPKLSLKAAWQVIDAARRARVTGELALTTASPAKTKIYLDSGTVYFAERETDETLATRLVLAGAIDPDQLHRGSLRLNGVEHLGRLFERDATVERDAVELALELMTEQTLTEVAEQEVLSSQITMYRQHSSGVARWFMDPVTGPAAAAAVASGEVSPPTSSPWQPPSSPAVDAVARVAHGNMLDVEESIEPRVLPTLPPPTAVVVARLVPRPAVNRLEQAVAAPISSTPSVTSTPEVAATAEAAEADTPAEVAELADGSVDSALQAETALEGDAVEGDVETDVTPEAVAEIGKEAIEEELQDQAVDDTSVDGVPVDDATEPLDTVETLADEVVARLDEKKTSTASGLQPMTPLMSLKSFRPITAVTQPVGMVASDDLADVVPAVAKENEGAPTSAPASAPTSASSAPLQRAPHEALRPITRQAMTPLQPMNLQQLTPHSGSLPIVNGSAPMAMSSFSRPKDPDLTAIPVPEDVAAAVRRAIEAIENAMHEPRAADVSFGPLHVTSLGQSAQLADQAHGVTGSVPATAAQESTVAHANAHSNGHVNGVDVTGENVVQTSGAKGNLVMSFGEFSSEGAVYPLPVLPPLAPRGNRPRATEQRKGALRRLIDGVRRR